MDSAGAEEGDADSVKLRGGIGQLISIGKPLGRKGRREVVSWC